MSDGLKRELEALTGAYYEEAPEGKGYPYAEIGRASCRERV